MPPKSKQAPQKGKSAITSFFKPASRPQSQADSPATSSEASLPPLPPSRPPSEPSASSPLPPPTQTPKSAFRVSLLASSPSLRSPSSLPPSSPVVNPAAPRPRDAIIAASDDEDDDFGGSDSDDDMVDLMAVYRKPDAEKKPIDASLFETPKAKRIMSKHVLSSPLTIQFKNDKHDFDMKALLKDAEQDNKTRASFLQNQEEAAAQAEIQAAAQAQGNKDAAFLDVINQAGGENAHKVLRTMKRAQSGQSALRYCFFESRTRPKGSVGIPWKKVAQGPWRLLIQGPISKREQFLASGMPYTILKMTGNLPEELFDYMLSDLCVTQSRLMQMEYSKLIGLSQGLVNTRLTPERLEGLFSLLGEVEELKTEEGALAIIRPSEDPYLDKNWSNLRAFLELLEELAEPMSVDSVTCAAHTLLRMAMDKFLLCSMDVLMAFEKSISALLGALPAIAWNNFCAEASQRLHGDFKAQCIRINALLSLPISSDRAHELRRRLAITFTFDDPALGAQHPDKIITIPRIIERVRNEDFDITSTTDYDELQAMILMLDIAVGDGSWVTTTNPEDEKIFNANVDELAAALRGVYRRINDTGGRASRSNVKGVFEWVEKRVLYQIRTKPKPKTSIFDTVKDKEDVNLPQQQNYMRSFLGRPLGSINKQGTGGV